MPLVNFAKGISSKTPSTLKFMRHLISNFIAVVSIPFRSLLWCIIKEYKSDNADITNLR